MYDRSVCTGLRARCALIVCVCVCARARARVCVFLSIFVAGLLLADVFPFGDHHPERGDVGGTVWRICRPGVPPLGVRACVRTDVGFARGGRGRGRGRHGAFRALLRLDVCVLPTKRNRKQPNRCSRLLCVSSCGMCVHARVCVCVNLPTSLHLGTWTRTPWRGTFRWLCWLALWSTVWRKSPTSHRWESCSMSSARTTPAPKGSHHHD